MIPLLNRGGVMKGFVQGADRQQTTLLPECLDDWVDESNPVRAVDVFVDALELRDLGFDGVDPAATGRPGYHPSPMLKLYIYGVSSIHLPLCPRNRTLLDAVGMSQTCQKETLSSPFILGAEVPAIWLSPHCSRTPAFLSPSRMSSNSRRNCGLLEYA